MIQFISSIIASIGGSIGISLILLRFFKKRIEVWTDKQIELRANIVLEEWKSKLEQQNIRYQRIADAEAKAMGLLVNHLNDLDSHLRTIYKVIDEYKSQNRSPCYLFNNEEYTVSLKRCIDVKNDLSKSIFEFSANLNIKIADDIKQLIGYLEILEKSLSDFSHNEEEYYNLVEKIGQRIENLIHSIGNELNVEME